MILNGLFLKSQLLLNTISSVTIQYDLRASKFWGPCLRPTNQHTKVYLQISTIQVRPSYTVQKLH